MREVTRFERFAAPAELDLIADWFWSVEWSLPPHTRHAQQVLSHPGANLSVGSAPPDGPNPPPGPYPVSARINGCHTGLGTRVLTGHGWNVAAKTSVGGLGVFVRQSATQLTDQVVSFADALSLDERPLITTMADADTAAERVRHLSEALCALLDHVEQRRIDAARTVGEIGRYAEHDRSIRRAETLARCAGLTVRTMQRLFAEYAGVGPTWVIRRYRLIEAADAVTKSEPVAWADVAASLGYSDQAHLIRDFVAVMGKTPAAYAAGVG